LLCVELRASERPHGSRNERRPVNHVCLSRWLAQLSQDYESS